MTIAKLDRSTENLLAITDRQAKRIRELEGTLRLRDKLIDGLDSRIKELEDDLVALDEAVGQTEGRAFDKEAITGLHARVAELETELEQYDFTELARSCHEWARDTLDVPHALDVPFVATPEAYRTGLAARIMREAQDAARLMREVQES